MFFNSLTFLAFLMLVLLLRAALPWRYGRWVLVAASYFFYGAANPYYCLLLFTSTAVDFVVARLIERASEQKHRKRLLLVSIVVNLGLLGFFKYADFALTNVNFLLTRFGLDPMPLLGLLLPVGISFYTFQTLSYTIDVYRGQMKATRDFGAFALYVAYFPQLVAGPIERAKHLLPQLSEKQKVSRADMELGFQRVLWGLLKKVVFADRLGLMVNAVYANPGEASSPVLVVATLCFTFQIYLDFSGYCDIALGVSRMMGVKLSENFKWPYLARDPSEFWSRWHVTLTNWFTDYVFMPLVGANRLKLSRVVPATVLTMVLIGLWHGAAWHFVVFGLLNGVSLAGYQAARALLPRKKRGPLLGRRWWSRPVSIAMMVPPVGLAMIFFRAPDVRTGVRIIGGILARSWEWPAVYNLHLVLVLILFAAHVIRGVLLPDRARTVKMPAPVRGLFWFVLVLVIIYGAVDTSQKFIYFQF